MADIPLPQPTPTIEKKVPGKEEEPTWENSKPIDETPTWENSKDIEKEPTWEESTPKYETPLQKIGTALEGAAQGIAGPLATAAELGLSKLGVPHLSEEDIKGRKEANPALYGTTEAAGFAGSLFLPFGQAKLIGQAATKIAQLAKINEAASIGAKIGSGVLKGALETGMFQASDNATKAMIGQGDPGESVSSIMANGVPMSALMGGALGGVGAAASKGLSALADSKMGTKLHSYLSGIGEAAKGKNPQESLARWSDEKAYDKGAHWFNQNLASKAITGASYLTAAKDVLQGIKEGEPEDAAKNVAIDILSGMGAKFAIKHLSNTAATLMLKAITNGETNPRALFQIIDYGNELNRGTQKLNKHVDNLFKIGSQQFYNYDFDKNRQKLDDYIKDGGIQQNIDESIYDQNETPQGFAEGGEVKPKREKRVPPILKDDDPISTHFPEHNMGMVAARGRISNYLSSIRPQPNQPKLAFDSEPDQRKQKKAYNRALDMANHPLSIMDKIKKGTIEAQDIQQLNALHPEVGMALQKKLSERITKAQMKREKPNHVIRQGMSLLMGTPLSGDMTPQYIQAAQTVFKGQPQNQPQQAPPKKKLSSLTKSDDSFLTRNQALVGRSQRQS